MTPLDDPFEVPENTKWGSLRGERGITRVITRVTSRKPMTVNDIENIIIMCVNLSSVNAEPMHK